MIPEAALNQHIAILGKTGSGKSYAARGMVESLLAKSRQVCVLDPTSAWWGLRLAADGKAKGFDVVLLGGEHADIPLAERSGAAVARLVTEQGASVVIDTGGLTVGQYTRWFIDFAGTLYTSIKSPLHLIIDEAHYFMPQGKVPDPETGRMLHAGNRLMSGGRSRGIRGLLITQRPQKLHKDSLTCADSLIAMRVISPQDRKAVKEWIDGAADPDQGKAVLDSLAQLKKGDGWVWFPEGGHLERVHFPPIKTYDSMATPTHGAKAGPKVGQIDLGEVKAAMAEAVKEAEANDPKLLRKRIAELESQVYKSAKSVQTDPKALEQVAAKARAEERRLVAGMLEERERIIRELSGRMGKAATKLADVSNLLHVNGEAKPAQCLQPPAKVFHSAEIPSEKPRAAVAQIQRPQRELSQRTQTDDISARQQRFLDAAAALTTLGAEVTRETVCGWVGVHPRGGSVGEELKALKQSGLITIDRGRIQVTDAGQAAAGHIDPSQAIERAKSGLTARQARFFEAIVAVYPGEISREAIAEQFDLHPRGGSLGEDLGRLVGRGLVDVNRGQYRAREFLFAAV